MLAVARASGLSIPSGCTFGVCGTCKVRKLAGYILACRSRPLGEVEIAA